MAQDNKYLETDFFSISKFICFLKPSVHYGTAKGPFLRAVDGGGAVVASVPGERGTGVVQSTKKIQKPVTAGELVAKLQPEIIKNKRYIEFQIMLIFLGMTFAFKAIKKVCFMLYPTHNLCFS